MKNVYKRAIKYIVLFITFSALYVWIEIMFRNRSDRSMAILGGVCGLLIGLCNNVIPWSMTLVQQALIGGLLIVTPMEYIVGKYIVNKDLSIWNYTNMPLNIEGQICLLFTFIWCVISLGVIVLDDYLRYFIFGEEKPHYNII